MKVFLLRLRRYGWLLTLALAVILLSGFLSLDPAERAALPLREPAAVPWGMADYPRSFYPHWDHRPRQERLPGRGTASKSASAGAQPVAAGLANPPGAIAARFGPLPPPCTAVVSDHQEYAPIQMVAAALPADSTTLDWVPPAPADLIGPFMGMVGWPASHEGTDYVQADPAVVNVAVVAAAAGQVVYVRRGCPQSAWFVPNHQQRECGAGWGNHVVIAHANGLLTRYAHLAPGSILVQVGDRLSEGNTLGLMGNSGRSDVRHLHFELGQKTQPLAACASAQSFDHVYDPAAVGL